MESEHFFLVLLDVEGNLMNSNNIFSKLSGSKSGKDFQKIIDGDSTQNFSELLEKTLNSPKNVQHALFNICRGKSDSVVPIWWEFSVITNCEGDLKGIIGVGVGIQFLEQGMPWDNLLDVLQFGKIRISKDKALIDWDDKVSNWLELSASELSGISILKQNVLPAFLELELAFNQISENGRPVCLVLKQPNSTLEFASLLTKAPEGFNLFILPRENKEVEKKSIKPFTNLQLGSLQGAVWVVDSDLNIIQLNQVAFKLGIIWNGKDLKEGSKFQFHQQSESFRKLISSCKNALFGNSVEFELEAKFPDQETGIWRIGIRPVYDENGGSPVVLVQAIDLFVLNRRFLNLQKENLVLKEMAMSPSHILRSPLSSMLGLLDLIDQKQLDSENQKYFSYLKPLARQLDNVIRSNAKKMNALN